MLRKLIDPASDALIETIWSLLIEKGLKSLKGNYKQHLQKAINKTIEEFEKQFPVSKNDNRLHFYASAKANAFLARFMLFGARINLNEFESYLREDPRIVIPSKEQIEKFIELFYGFISEAPDIKHHFIEENYKERIFQIGDSIGEINRKLDFLLTFQELKASSPTHKTWLDKIQKDVYDLKFQTALEHLDLLETELRKENRLSKADHAKILLLKGICLYEQGEVDKGEEAWMTAWRFDPHNMQVKEKALRVQVDRGKFESANQLILEILQSDPINPVAWAAKTFLDEGLLEDKLPCVPLAISEVEASHQLFKMRLAGFYIHHEQQQNLRKIFQQEMESDIQFPTNITFENKGYWLLLSNFYLAQIAIQYNQIPDKVNPLVRNNPKLPKVVALFDKVLQPLENTEKGRFLEYYKYWHRYAKYCLEGSAEEALRVLEAYKELPIKYQVEPIPTLTAFVLLQTEQLDVLLDFAQYAEIGNANGVLVPKALALAGLGKNSEAQETLTTFFEKLAKFEEIHLATFLNFQSDFTPTQELKERQWLVVKDKIENPTLRKIAELATFWDSQLVEQRRAMLVELKNEVEASDSAPLLILGLLFFQNGDFVQAMEVFRPSLDFSVESPDHLYYIVALAISHHDDAELLARLEHWRRSGFTIYPDWLSWEIQFLQSLPDAEQIVEVAAVGIERFPNDARFHMIKVVELERLGRSEEIQSFLKSDISFIAGLTEPQVIQLSGIMLRSGLEKEGIEVLFPLAENPSREVARANYFFAFSMVDGLPFPKNLDKVVEDCWVDIEEDGEVKLVRISPENSTLPSYEVLLGKGVGETVESVSRLSSRKSIRIIKEIFDKYTGLDIQIIRQVNSEKSLASAIESFDMPTDDIAAFNQKMVELFGEDGDRRKQHFERVLQQYANREIGFSQLVQGLGGNPIEVFYHLTNQNDGGLQALPVVAFRHANPDSLKDAKFALDFTSLLLFYELSESGVEFSQRFLISPFLVEIIEHRRFEIEWVKDSSLSVNITSQGVVPTFYPEDYKQVRLAFFDKLLAWVNTHCEIRRSRHKLTLMGHAIRDEKELVKKENHFSRFFLDTLFLSDTPSENVILISDDLDYYRFFHGHTNLISTEVFLREFYSEWLQPNIFPKILRLGCKGFSLPTPFVRDEYQKQVQGEENLFDRCLKNLGTNHDTILTLLFDIYSSDKLLISQKRVLSQKVMSNFLTWGIPDKFVYDAFQFMLFMKFRFLPNQTAEVLDDWAIVCGKGYGLIPNNL